MSSKNSITTQLEAIQQVLQGFPQGALAEDIEAHLTFDLNRRTLLRRLDKLKDVGILTIIGKGRATRYQLLGADVAAANVDQSLLTLSTVGEQLGRLVTRPLAKRVPVGYARTFLDDYQPNHTFYLTALDREKLHVLGKTSVPDQPAGTYARVILNRLLIDLSWNSSRLEGNTYSLLDTQRLLDLGEAAEGKSAMDAQMILNHKSAIEFLVETAGEIGFNRFTILNLHAMLANNLLPDPSASGRLRCHSVGIAQSVFEPLDVPQLIAECFDELLAKASAINDPFEQAFFVMVHLPYLQPFDDVNKRVSRLAANIPLIAKNLTPLSFVDVPNDVYVRGMLAVYELNQTELLKDVFLWAYERSSSRYAALRQSLGQPDPFRLRYRDAIRTLVSEIVTGVMNQKFAATHIENYAMQLPASERAQFIEAVETEVLALHEGNFARYYIRPSEFALWQSTWGK